MKLLRLATVHFDVLPKEWHSWQAQHGTVQVQTHGASEVEGRLRLLVVAQVSIERPRIGDDGFVVVLDGPRRRAEAAIEAVANLVALAQRCGRSIFSAMPCVAFLPENEDETAWLSSSKGLSSELSTLQRFRPRLGLDLGALSECLLDRMDGVALLCEALSTGHAMGKFREFLRLFERAFRCSSRRLEKALTDFLSGERGGYTRREVTKWVVELRDPAIHADRRNKFLLESGVRPVVHRMEDAAYDVLLNKAEWRSTCVKRRGIWSPPAGTSSEHGMFAKLGAANGLRLEVQMLDPFGSYPIDLGAGLSSPPDEWWTGTGKPTDHESG